MKHRAYLSLGSNVGNRVSNLGNCVRLLSKLGDVTKVSFHYETEPMEVREQPWFINCVVELQTDLGARELLAGIRSIEAELGRTREVHKGPRTIDIDILFFDSEVIDNSDLRIPHVAMHKRGFVLAPLVEIAPHLRHPILGKTVEQLWRELPADAGEVRRLATR